MKENFKLNFILHIKINFKWIVNLDVRYKTLMGKHRRSSEPWIRRVLRHDIKADFIIEKS